MACGTACGTACRMVMMNNLLGVMILKNVRSCRVAEFFAMMPLRTEALYVICQKASYEHLPLLKDLHDTSEVPELEAVISRLQSC